MSLRLKWFFVGLRAGRLPSTQEFRCPRRGWPEVALNVLLESLQASQLDPRLTSTERTVQGNGVTDPSVGSVGDIEIRRGFSAKTKA